MIFRIEDNGIGIKSDQIDNLFKSYAQADPLSAKKFGGTGLDLEISQSFCQMMSRIISVESVLGDGAIFTVKLPANWDLFLMI
jgi:signal transduction histidine kinase